MKAHILNTTPCTVPNSIYFSTLPMKKKRRERKAEFNSQSHFWIVLCQVHAVNTDFFFFCQITTTTLTYLRLRAGFLHILHPSPRVSCFLETLSTLLFILLCCGNIHGRTVVDSCQSDIHPSGDRKWSACQKNNLDNSCSKYHPSTTLNNSAGTQQWIQDSVTLLPERVCYCNAKYFISWLREKFRGPRERMPSPTSTCQTCALLGYGIFFSATWEERRSKKRGSSLIHVAESTGMSTANYSLSDSQDPKERKKIAHTAFE